MTDAITRVIKKKPKKISPTQLTLKHLRGQGYMAAVVEHWNPHARIRQDLFGIIDVLAVGVGDGDGITVGVQSTSLANLSSRIKKMAASDSIAELRKAGWMILAHGWKKVGGRWQLKEVDLS